jgi:oligopeptide/dipeptide ABC transporter ATP-binding protein
VLEVKDLRVCFSIEEGDVKAVDGVTFTIPRGKVLAIVGESGCGKSVTAYSILRLIERPGRITGGQIIFHPLAGEPVDITALDERDDLLYQVRGGYISMIFQEPMTALSPVHTVGNQLMEAILHHQQVTRRGAAERAAGLLRQVGIPGPQERLRQFPFEMSGGMRQRVVIAMALACHPQLLIADEPTTALDVTIQAQILQVMMSLQQQSGVSILLITHDLGVVAQTAGQVAVMYLGRIVEHSDIRSVIHAPAHPYTAGLLRSLPQMSGPRLRLQAIRGSVPSMMAIPPGCPFHPRCDYAQAGRCDLGAPPPLREVSPGHRVACLRAEEIRPSSLPPKGREGAQ